MNSVFVFCARARVCVCLSVCVQYDPVVDLVKLGRGEHITPLQGGQCVTTGAPSPQVSAAACDVLAAAQAHMLPGGKSIARKSLLLKVRYVPSILHCSGFHVLVLRTQHEQHSCMRIAFTPSQHLRCVCLCCVCVCVCVQVPVVTADFTLDLPAAVTDSAGHQCLIILPSDKPSTRHEALALESLLAQILRDPATAVQRCVRMRLHTHTQHTRTHTQVQRCAGAL